MVGTRALEFCVLGWLVFLHLERIGLPPSNFALKSNHSFLSPPCQKQEKGVGLLMGANAQCWEGNNLRAYFKIKPMCPALGRQRQEIL